MIGGVYGYAVIGVVVGGLGLACYGLYQRGEAAQARAADLERQRDTAIQAVKDSEEVNAKLRASAKLTDGILVAKDARIAQLLRGQRALKGELNELKKDVPQADRDCLDRSLPPSFADRLRGS